MGVSYFQDNKLLAVIFGSLGCDVGCRFDGSTVSDPDEAENGTVTFRDAEDVILEVGASGSYGDFFLEAKKTGRWEREMPTPHSSLALLFSIFHADNCFPRIRVMLDSNKRLNRHRHLPQRPLNINHRSPQDCRAFRRRRRWNHCKVYFWGDR